VSDDLSIPNPGYRGKRAGRYGTGPNRGRPGMDPDTRRLVMFAGGLGAVLVALIGASAVIGHRGNEVPVVAADARPIRVKPDNPGGMKIDGAENDVFSGGSDTADSKLAPPPEKPDAKALRTAAAPAPPVVQTQASTVVASPAPAAKQAAPASGPSPARPVIAASEPAAKPAAAAPVKPPMAAVEANPPAPGHAAMVQLAALTSEAAARDEWQQLAKHMPDLMNGRRPVFARTERDGHVLWRVRTAGFADVAQARSFCDRVRAKGAGCSIADF
jgi:hypothetical protein